MARVAPGEPTALTGRGGPGRGQGRKAADGASGMRRYNVMLDDASITKAKLLGDGELSAGIRRALAKAKVNARNAPR